MAVTRIGLGGPGISYGVIADKAESAYTSRVRWGIMGSLCRWILAYG